MAAAGFVVRVGRLSSSVWYVAVDNPDAAMQAARDVAGSDAAYEPIQILSELTQAEVDQLKLAAGQAQKRGPQPLD